MVFFILLFAMTGFFLALATSYAWSIFFNQKPIQQLANWLRIPGKYALLKAIFLIPLLFFDIIVIKPHFLSTNAFLFFTVKSPSVLWNVLGFLIAYGGLVVINYKFKEDRVDFYQIGLSIMVYLLTLYVSNLIIIIATMVSCLNAVSDSLQHSFFLLYTVLLLHFIFVYLAMLIKRPWQIMLAIVYALVITQMNYTIRAGTLRQIMP